MVVVQVLMVWFMAVCSGSPMSLSDVDAQRVSEPSSTLTVSITSALMLSSANIVREIEGVQTEVLLQSFVDRILVLITQLGKVGSLVRLPSNSYQHFIDGSSRSRPLFHLQCRCCLHLLQIHLSPMSFHSQYLHHPFNLHLYSAALRQSASRRCTTCTHPRSLPSSGHWKAQACWKQTDVLLSSGLRWPRPLIQRTHRS